MIKISGLTKVYNEGMQSECKALNGVDIEIGDGESIAITGKSGSGKSTFMHILCGIETATAGSVTVDDLEITKLSDIELARFRSQNLGIVMQDFCLIDAISVMENVMLPLDFVKMPHAERKKRVINLVGGVGLIKYLKKKTALLSGGEKQRVAIARALVADPPYIFADEPTGSLDVNTSREIIDKLLDINNKRGKTVIIITHDSSIASEFKRQIKFSDGKIIEDITQH
ncbi:MAG: ABC transporter ATP-binding protein [Christensenellaceae bacterium]|jgi:putative ABC transport system ATP-binding protein|nr:ABC transporter ATP-binding protein [Christensenellaceae bacterium]